MIPLAEFEIEWSRLIGPVVGASISAAIALLIYFLNRARPTKIECTEISMASLMQFSESIRDRIKASFDGREVASLSRAEVEFKNRGTASVKDCKIVLEFSEGTSILECEVSPEDSGTFEIRANKLIFHLNYLNAWRHHKDRVRLSVLCDGELNDFKVAGRDYGWSVVLISRKNIRRRLIGLAMALGGFILGVLVLGAVLKSPAFLLVTAIIGVIAAVCIDSAALRKLDEPIF